MYDNFVGGTKVLQGIISKLEKEWTDKEVGVNGAVMDPAKGGRK